MPDVILPGSETLYARFHGTRQWYLHDYSDPELTEWAQDIRASQATEAWLYFNNDRQGYAEKNALQLRRIFREMERWDLCGHYEDEESFNPDPKSTGP